MRRCYVVLQSTTFGDAVAESESGPNPEPLPAPAPIAYDLSGIINAVLKILYAILRGENFGLPRLLG